MKKNILLIVAAVMALASCGRKMEYVHMTFATFDAASYSYNEDVGEFVVPVSIVNPTGSEVSVSVKTIDGKAQEGVDFEIISPVSGILTFAPGESEQEIIVGVNYDPSLTGTKDFTVAIASATEGFQVGGCNTAKIRIKDDNHPLKMFIGEWTASATGATGLSYAWSMIIEGDESDPTWSNLLVYDLEPLTSNYLGYNSENGYNVVDAKANDSKTQIIVAYDSYLASDEDGFVYSVACLNNPNYSLATNFDDVKMDLSKDGKTLTIANALVCLGSDGYLQEAVNGPLVFTKK